MNKEIKSISSPNDVVRELNKINQEQDISGYIYYHFDMDDDNIITNVPRDIYERQLDKYIAPQRLDENFIELLKQNIDFFHNRRETENFRLNRCFENSEIIFEFLKQLDSDKDFNITSSVKIVYGYFSRKIPLNTSVGDKVITKEFVLHDWHVWNYINNIIIDVSILKAGTFLGIDISTPTTWGRADDYVFVIPPSGIDYYGIEFDNREEFIKDFRKTFNV